MEIYLSKELQELVKQRVEAGHYYSADEMISHALWLLDATDRFNDMQTDVLRKEIQKGLDSGPSAPLDIEAIKKEVRRS